MDDRKIALCKYRLEKSAQCLESAKILLNSGDYCSAANRSYYSIFHCIRSILALDGIDFSKHAGVMAYFQKNYVRSGIFEKEYSKILTKAFEVRTESDYDDYYVISKVDVEDQISQAHLFFDGVSNYVEKRLSKEPR